MSPWSYLVAAGLLEILFTTLMKLSEGLSRLWPTLGFLATAALSFFCLNRSLSQIPLGTAYAVWTGLGAFGTVVVGMIFFKDPVSWPRILLLSLLIGSVIGLKFIDSSASPS